MVVVIIISIIYSFGLLLKVHIYTNILLKVNLSRTFIMSSSVVVIILSIIYSFGLLLKVHIYTNILLKVNLSRTFIMSSSVSILRQS